MTTSPSEITLQERQVVELIAAGMMRWAIADQLGLSEFAVRNIVRRLCFALDCRMYELPDVLGIHPPAVIVIEEPTEDEADETFHFRPEGNAA